MIMEDLVKRIDQLKIKYETLKKEIARKIVGQEEIIDKILVAIFSNGHCLLIGVPGLAKTLMVTAISETLDLKYKRIQFTPDLMPSDIIGTEILDNQKEFRFIEGPLFANIILADEINRTPPKTQSALLGAMQEQEITAAGTTRKLEQPFFVLATQNPVESESTFRLPAAQMDRFLIRISMGYPQPEEEREMLRSLGDEIPFHTVQAVTSAGDLVRAQKEIAAVHVSDAVADYIVALVGMTRSHDQLVMGASPRASRGLYRAAKVWAAMEGRDFVTPDDVKTLAHPVLEHRLVLSSGARFSGASAAAVLDDVLSRVEASPALGGSGHEA